MRILSVCLFISVLAVQSVVATELTGRKRICESDQMDRIVLEVVQVSQSGEASVLNYQQNSDEDETSWRRRHPIATGALVGFGIGFGYAAFVAIAADDINFPIAGLLFGTIGAGIGALIGSFF